jgi:hypothetical protein
MLDRKPPFIVAAYIPCRTCGEACVVLERFAQNPADDELDRHPFQAICGNCGESQSRVGRDAFRRTVVEWKLVNNASE